MRQQNVWWFDLEFLSETYFVIIMSMYSMILFPQNMSYSNLRCSFVFDSKIEDGDLTLQYLLCAIVSYPRGIFRKHFDIFDVPCWKLEFQFVFLQCIKRGQLLWRKKKTDAKTNGIGIVPLLTEYSVCVQYAVHCKCLWKRLGLIHKVHFLLHLSRMFISLLYHFIVTWSKLGSFVSVESERGWETKNWFDI